MNEEPRLFEESIVEYKYEGPVTVFGITFSNDEERRTYFREELRKKLPDLRHLEGFPIGSDEDIINLSDPPYYTACPNPWLNDFLTDWELNKQNLIKSGKRQPEREVKEPYSKDVAQGKYNDIYFKHPYHTKVPIAAIEQYLNHYVQNGDIVLDGFAGTGMTGVACNLSEIDLKSITIDLSTIASFINYYYNYCIDPKKLQKSFDQIMSEVMEQCLWMYRTKHANDNFGIINSVFWSEVFICPNCGKEVVFWGNGVDIEHGKVLDTISCPHCKASFKKRNDLLVKNSYFDKEIDSSQSAVKLYPFKISYSYAGRTYYKEPDKYDLDLLEKIDNYKIDNWVPTYSIEKGEKTYDVLCADIQHVHQLYFRRNLIVFSEFYKRVKDPRLLGILTAVAFRINKRYALTYMSGQWGAGGGPTNGTFYIPALMKELNGFEVLKSSLAKYSKAFFEPSNFGIISTQSSTHLNIPNDCIDYIFTDPPFGGNFIYSELNYIWESWLKVFTNSKEEAITCNFYGKTGDVYHRLMRAVFSEYYRVLKPSHWLSVEFSNTKAAIWNILRSSLQEAGFIIVGVSTLDKQKGSFNAQTTTTAVKQDLIVTCFKPSKNYESTYSPESAITNTWDLVYEILDHSLIHLSKGNKTTTVVERSGKVLYDKIIAYYVKSGLPVPIDSIDFQRGLRERFVERDGMYFTAKQAIEYDEKRKLTSEFVPLTLFIGSESEGIDWLKRKLENSTLAYSDIQPFWMQNLVSTKKGDNLPELMTILEENFLKTEDGKWRCPDPEKEADLEKIRIRRLLKEFNVYYEIATKPKGKIKEARIEALRAGFKHCYQEKDFAKIVNVGNKLPESLLMEDDVLMQYFDIATNRI